MCWSVNGVKKFSPAVFKIILVFKLQVHILKGFLSSLSACRRAELLRKLILSGINVVLLKKKKTENEFTFLKSSRNKKELIN